MIVLDGVTQVFDGRAGPVPALAGIDFEVGENEFVAVIGRSGCGKSTLLRLIAGLLPPTGGRISVGGEPVTRPRRDVSVMFQRPALLPWRSVLANVMLPIEIFGLERKSYRDRAHELLELVGLRGFEKRLPHELSGELQRIQLEQPRTVVFVTHSIEEAVVLADRVAVLTPRPGRLRKIVDLAIPRPRVPGRPDVDQAGRELRDLLTEPLDGGAT